jgi:hypothetical protein
MLRHKSAPLVDASAPTSKNVTTYDEHRFPLYIQLLDANTVGARWEDVADSVLGLDIHADRVSAHHTWQSHLNRAKWMTEVGYRDLLK